MIASAHIAVGFASGLLIAKYIPEPYLASGVAFTSGLALHYLTDLIPHGHFIEHEKVTSKKGRLLIFTDLILSGLIFLFLIYMHDKPPVQSIIIGVSVIGNLLPDVIASQVAYPGKKIPEKGFFAWENKLHWDIVHWHGTYEKALKWNIWDFWQIAVTIISIYLGLKIR